MSTARIALVGTWLGTTVLLGAGLLTVHLGVSGLDDPDPAHQRPGFLDANAPRSAAPVVPGLGPAGTRSVVFFSRRDRLVLLERALAGPDGSALARVARIVVVVDGSGPSTAGVVADPQERLSRLDAMRRPRDGGAPVGKGTGRSGHE